MLKLIKKLKQTAASFQSIPIQHYDPSGDKREVGLIGVATQAAGFMLAAPTKNAACSALSIFGHCTDNKELEKIVDTFKATQKQLHEILL